MADELVDNDLSPPRHSPANEVEGQLPGGHSGSPLQLSVGVKTERGGILCTLRSCWKGVTSLSSCFLSQDPMTLQSGLFPDKSSMNCNPFFNLNHNPLIQSEF